MHISDKLQYYKDQVLDSYKLIEKLIGDEIKEFYISSGDSGLTIQFQYKLWKFTLTHTSVTEQIYEPVYKRFIDSLFLYDGLDSDEFFNLSMERDICVFLKAENILMIRQYVKEATNNYFKLKNELEY